MRKALIALAIAATAFVATVAIPHPADARNHRFWTGFGVGVGAAILFGAAARAALAPQYHAYVPVEGFYTYPLAYAGPAPIACPNGFWAAQPIAYDALGRPVRWSRPRWFCPPPGYTSAAYVFVY